MIETDNLSKAYPRTDGSAVEALKNISFQIAAGEFVVVRGASGSGKSTLLNLLGCLDRPSSGSYRLDGEDVARYSDKQLSRIRNARIGFYSSRSICCRGPQQSKTWKSRWSMTMAKSIDAARCAFWSASASRPERTISAPNSLAASSSAWPSLARSSTTLLLFSPMNLPGTWMKTQDARSCDCFLNCMARAEQFFSSRTMMRLPNTLAARSFCGMASSFPIAPDRALGLGPTLQFEAPYEARKTVLSGDTQYGTLSAAHYADDARHRGGNSFAGYSHVDRRGNQTRDHTTLQEYDWHLRHDHGQARRGAAPVGCQRW